LLTRHGRSQAEVIEEALESLPLQGGDAETKARRERIDEICRRMAETPGKFSSIEQFDRETYDERGLLR